MSGPAAGAPTAQPQNQADADATTSQPSAPEGRTLEEILLAASFVPVTDYRPEAVATHLDELNELQAAVFNATNRSTPAVRDTLQPLVARVVNQQMADHGAINSIIDRVHALATIYLRSMDATATIEFMATSTATQTEDSVSNLTHRLEAANRANAALEKRVLALEALLPSQGPSSDGNNNRTLSTLINGVTVFTGDRLTTAGGADGVHRAWFDFCRSIDNAVNAWADGSSFRPHQIISLITGRLSGAASIWAHEWAGRRDIFSQSWAAMRADGTTHFSSNELKLNQQDRLTAFDTRPWDGPEPTEIFATYNSIITDAGYGYDQYTVRVLARLWCPDLSRFVYTASETVTDMPSLLMRLEKEYTERRRSGQTPRSLRAARPNVSPLPALAPVRLTPEPPALQPPEPESVPEPTPAPPGSGDAVDDVLGGNETMLDLKPTQLVSPTVSLIAATFMDCPCVATVDSGSSAMVVSRKWAARWNLCGKAIAPFDIAYAGGERVTVTEALEGVFASGDYSAILPFFVADITSDLIIGTPWFDKVTITLWDTVTNKLCFTTRHNSVASTWSLLAAAANPSTLPPPAVNLISAVDLRDADDILF
ncbi:hypothetical protein BC831DRAFT_518090, partial [Entophlyctis helioformis]